MPIGLSDEVEIVIEYEDTGIINYLIVGTPVSFGSLSHSTFDNPATSGSVTITNTGPVSINTSIRADDFASGSYFIGLGNCTYNTVNDNDTSIPMPKTYTPVTTLTPSEYVDLYFWIDVPILQKALNYETNLYIELIAA